MLFVGTKVVPDPTQFRPVTLVQGSENFKLRNLLVIVAREVPAENIEEELELIRVIADAKHDVDLLEDLEELDSDRRLTAMSTAHQPVKEVH